MSFRKQSILSGLVILTVITGSLLASCHFFMSNSVHAQHESAGTLLFSSQPGNCCNENVLSQASSHFNLIDEFSRTFPNKIAAMFLAVLFLAGLTRLGQYQPWKMPLKVYGYFSRICHRLFGYNYLSLFFSRGILHPRLYN